MRDDVQASPAPERCRRLRALLIDWFDAGQRDLPWRRTSDPYRIWLSEVMLQQTQVERVIDYYERFLLHFPTIEALAAASLDDVLKLWEGLGYYSRARNLLAAARIICERHGGRFPSDSEAARALPGVGEYTSGAVLSIAYGVPLPALDANAVRVFARLFGVEGDPARGETRRRLREIARAAVPDDRPGDFNQAVMELGATVCIAGRPDCLICPVVETCAARAAGLETETPPRRRSRASAVTEVAAVARDGDCILLMQRPHDSYWPGLWVFPSAEFDGPNPGEAVEALLHQAGLEAEAGHTLLELSYGIMDRRVELTVLCTEVGGEPTADRWRWVALAEIEDLAMPSPHRTIAQALPGG